MVLSPGASSILKRAVHGLAETHGPGQVEAQREAGSQFPYRGISEEVMDLAPSIFYLDR